MLRAPPRAAIIAAWNCNLPWRVFASSLATMNTSAPTAGCSSGVRITPSIVFAAASGAAGFATTAGACGAGLFTAGACATGLFPVGQPHFTTAPPAAPVSPSATSPIATFALAQVTTEAVALPTDAAAALPPVPATQDAIAPASPGGAPAPLA